MIQEGSFVLVHDPKIVARVRRKSLEMESLELVIVGGGDRTGYPFLYSSGSLIYRFASNLTEITGTEDQITAMVHLLGAS